MSYKKFIFLTGSYPIKSLFIGPFGVNALELVVVISLLNDITILKNNVRGVVATLTLLF